MEDSLGLWLCVPGGPSESEMEDSSTVSLLLVSIEDM